MFVRLSTRRTTRQKQSNGIHTTLPHEFLCQPEPSVRPHDAETRNVPVLHAVRGLFFHFGEDVADDFGGVVGRALRVRGVDCDVGELGPGEGVVEVVFHEVVFGEVGDVGGLDVREVGGVEQADVHC